MRLQPTPSNILAAICLIIIIAAPFRSTMPSEYSVADITGDEKIIQATVIDATPGETTMTLTVDRIDVAGQVYDDRLLLRVPRFPETPVGARISFSCAPKAPEPIEEFAYDKYLAVRRVFAICTLYDAPLIIEANADERVTTKLAALRVSMINFFGRVLPEPEATLLGGLLLGNAEFSDEWRERFVATGTSHIVAASGFNVGLVVIVLSQLLAHLGIRRRHAFAILFIGIIAYVILAGAGAAVVRAGVMGSLVLMASVLGRKTTPRNIILLAFAAMLLLNPGLLLWDPGFQLSALSTIALLALAPKLTPYFTFIPEAIGLRESFVASLAATLVTLPLIVVLFGTVSLVSPLVNLLILPMVPYAMILGAVGTAAAAFVPAIGSILLLPAWGMLSIMLLIIEAIAAVPFAGVALSPEWRIVVAVPILIVCGYIWYRAAKQPQS